MNWIRIFASSGYAFFVTLAGMFTVNAFYNLNVPLVFYIETSLLVAFVNAGLTFFRELLKEAEKENNDNKRKGKNKKTAKLLDVILLI